MIDYRKRLTTHRKFYPIDDIDSSVESDRGRIISAPSLRRLQKRTQVFALELNAAVRSRLTHSLEVQQTSRYIAKSILSLIKEKHGLGTYHLEDMENAFISTTEMASLLHDIGNPPFGHFAEMAINEWMEKEGPVILEKLCSSSPETNELREKLLKDLSNFDGNAQAIRIVHKLQRLNLSYTQTASILKYTRGAYESKPKKDSPFSYLQKKPGYYYSEKDFVQEICDTLEMEKGSRFPLTYIMEAADDISYLTADLEDAVDKRILTLDKIYRLVQEESEKVNSEYGTNETYLVDLVKDAYEKAQKDDKPYQFNLFLVMVRAKLINSLVWYVAKTYVEYHEAIFQGTFNHSLLEFDKTNKYFIAVKILQNISVKHIYHNLEVETLELKGHAILTGLLNLYKPILEVSFEDMSKLLHDKKIDNYLAAKFFHRLSRKHIVAYSVSVEDIDETTHTDEEKKLLEWYFRSRLLLDYISGMTDDYALQEYQTLSAL